MKRILLFVGLWTICSLNVRCEVEKGIQLPFGRVLFQTQGPKDRIGYQLTVEETSDAGSTNIKNSAWLTLVPCVATTSTADMSDDVSEQVLLRIWTGDSPIATLTDKHAFLNMTLPADFSGHLVIESGGIQNQDISYHLVVTRSKPYLTMLDYSAEGDQLTVPPWKETESVRAFLCRTMFGQSRGPVASTADASSLVSDPLRSSVTPIIKPGKVVLRKRDLTPALDPLTLRQSPVEGTQLTCAEPVKLSFCDTIAYTVPRTSATFEQIDNTTRTVYNQFKSRLYQYKCSDANTTFFFTPLRTCDDCMSAYKSWLCAMQFPRCQGGQAVKPCEQLCYKVMQNCPSFLNFRCPWEETANRTYASAGELCNDLSAELAVSGSRVASSGWIVLYLLVAILFLME